MAIKIIKEPSKAFRAECMICHAVLEYTLDDVSCETVQCPCCSSLIYHFGYGKPVREGDDK